MRGRRGIKVTQEKMDSLELEHYIEGRIGSQGTGIEVTEGKDEQLTERSNVLWTMDILRKN